MMLLPHGKMPHNTHGERAGIHVKHQGKEVVLAIPDGEILKG